MPADRRLPRRVTVSAELAEQAVIAAVKELVADVSGTANVEPGAEHAERDLEQAEQELDAAVRAFTGLDDVAPGRERLTELREARDRAGDRLAEMQAAAVPAVTVTAADCDVLTVDEQRALVRAVVERATVAPGRGCGRITVEPRGE